MPTEPRSEKRKSHWGHGYWSAFPSDVIANGVLRQFSKSELLAWLHLASKADFSTGRTIASMAEIGRQVSESRDPETRRRTAIKAVRKLEAAGLVVLLERGGGYGKANEYVLQYRVGADTVDTKNRGEPDTVIDTNNRGEPNGLPCRPEQATVSASTGNRGDAATPTKAQEETDHQTGDGDGRHEYEIKREALRAAGISPTTADELAAATELTHLDVQGATRRIKESGVPAGAIVIELRGLRDERKLNPTPSVEEQEQADMLNRLADQAAMLITGHMARTDDVISMARRLRHELGNDPCDVVERVVKATHKIDDLADKARRWVNAMFFHTQGKTPRAEKTELALSITHSPTRAADSDSECDRDRPRTQDEGGDDRQEIGGSNA